MRATRTFILALLIAALPVTFAGAQNSNNDNPKYRTQKYAPKNAPNAQGGKGFTPKVVAPGQAPPNARGGNRGGYAGNGGGRGPYGGGGRGPGWGAVIPGVVMGLPGALPPGGGYYPPNGYPPNGYAPPGAYGPDDADDALSLIHI